MSVTRCRIAPASVICLSQPGHDTGEAARTHPRLRRSGHEDGLSRGGTALTLSRYGWKEILILSIVFGVITAGGVVCYWPVAVAGVLLWPAVFSRSGACRTG